MPLAASLGFYGAIKSNRVLVDGVIVEIMYRWSVCVEAWRLSDYRHSTMRLLEWPARISVDISWGIRIGGSRVRPMVVWLPPELNNNLKSCPFFMDHYIRHLVSSAIL